MECLKNMEGVSSAFLLKSLSKMAARYKNDPGMLEKHHSIRAFELLISKDLDLLRNLPTDDRVDLILGTDVGSWSSWSRRRSLWSHWSVAEARE
jgi:hypothetical protein